MKLKDMHRGSMVFIDSNILTYHLLGHNIFGGPCRIFLKMVERGEYESYVNDVVLSEILLNFVKSELFRLRGIKPHKVVRELKGEPSLIELVNFDAVTKLSENLRVEILPIEYKCKEIVEFISRYSLLPNDAIHAATMKSIWNNEHRDKRLRLRTSRMVKGLETINIVHRLE